jgi:hypothetical protein
MDSLTAMTMNGSAQGLGYGRLNGNVKEMDGLSGTQRQRGNATAIDGLLATAMNSSATGSLAMDGAMAW